MPSPFPAVWRWQQPYGEQGVDGLLHDKTRKPGLTPRSPKTVGKVLELTCSAPPGEATHWTGRAMANPSNPAAQHTVAAGPRDKMVCAQIQSAFTPPLKARLKYRQNFCLISDLHF